MSKKYLTDEEELEYFNSEKFKQDVKNIRNNKMENKLTVKELKNNLISNQQNKLTDIVNIFRAKSKKDLVKVLKEIKEIKE